MSKDSKLGKKIKELRKSKGLTQEKLVELANIDNKHLSKIENGIHLPTYKTLKKLSQILNFNLQDIETTEVEQNLFMNNQIYAKAIKILNSAKTDKELLNYYETLKLVSKLMHSI